MNLFKQTNKSIASVSLRSRYEEGKNQTYATAQTTNVEVFSFFDKILI